MPAEKQPAKMSSKILIRTGEIDDTQLPYLMADGIIASNYPELAEMNLVIFYSYGMKRDQYDKLKLGDIRLCNKDERQLHGKDVKLYINYDFWHHSETRDSACRALIDRYLWRVRPRMDKELEVPIRDEQGRIVYGLREFDIQDSVEVIERNGVWYHEMEAAAEVIARVWEENQRGKQVHSGTEDDDPDGGSEGGDHEVEERILAPGSKFYQPL